MKKILLAAVAVGVTLNIHAAELSTDDQKISYAVGTQIGETLKNSVNGPIELNQDALFAAISDALAGETPKLSAEEMNQVMQTFSQKAIEHQKTQAAEAAAKNKAEADALLAENQAKDGVVVTDSGLQYLVVSEGNGDKPTAEDTVRVHYKGTFADGTEFDSSYSRGEPAEFPVNAVIPGWVEALQLMSEGGKFELVIPPELAYGDQGPANIGPSRALKFEVELIEIVKPDNAAAEAAEAAKAVTEAAVETATDAAKGAADATAEAAKDAMDATKEAVKEAAK
ncbi:FKBP-type peptidyl-prolyl cis-trans isomerase [Ostreibacterium oceani]|uniref:Peptidyl-prolyl cis-trans isomerase n=1 Tax=Ostreibacterium oceani TaxID=2654998 RepID=A0A6N7EY51_9GAMM|nr:FKBP-type peptidyl-prolyl cis-trans isomerase [Ostreibacterium oceani]